MDEHTKSIFLTGQYEPNQFAFLDQNLHGGMVFVDVGANLGLYSLFASKKVSDSGTVLALEPSSREYERLRRNISYNGLANVRTLQIAASDHAGEAELLIAEAGHAGHNTLGDFGYDARLLHKERVGLQRLDTLAENEKLSRVDIIKMDVEGAELFALRGAQETIAKYRPILMLELSDRTLRLQGCNSREIWELLTGWGYKLFEYDGNSGLPVSAAFKEYFDGENIIAVHANDPRLTKPNGQGAKN
jgi:FkbM family methyltransferase